MNQKAKPVKPAQKVQQPVAPAPVQKTVSESTEKFIKLNSFLLGVITVFLMVNFLDSHKNILTPSKQEAPAKTTKTVKAKAPKKEFFVSGIKKDPRCPRHLPVYDERWGCVMTSGFGGN